jgi:hypothetical protein
VHACDTDRVGGRRYSLLDIEHGVLRAQMTQPSNVILALGGRMTVPKFNSKDARCLSAIGERVPVLSFTLGVLTRSSPAVRCLTSAITVRTDLEAFAADYLNESVHFDGKRLILWLPVSAHDVRVSDRSVCDMRTLCTAIF